MRTVKEALQDEEIEEIPIPSKARMRDLTGQELELAEKLRLRARRLGASYEQIAKRANVTPQAVYQALEGHYAMSLRTLTKYASILGLKLEIVLREK